MTSTLMTIAVLSIAAICAAQEEDNTVRFTVTNPAAHDVRTVARVSLPVPQGMVAGGASLRICVAGEFAPAQTHVITRHPDGSVRRMMASVPVSLAGAETVECSCAPGEAVGDQRSLLSEGSPECVTEAWTLRLTDAGVEIADGDGRTLGAVVAFGPPLEPEGESELTVLDAGAQFVWLRLLTRGSDFSRLVDLQVDRLGHTRIVHYIQKHTEGNDWTPDFGLRLSAPGASIDVPLAEPLHFRGLDPRSTLAENMQLVTTLELADGTGASVANPVALMQTRGTQTVGASADAVTVAFDRNEPVEDLETEGLMIQEGQWRFVEMVVGPTSPAELAARLDSPVYGHADWRAYDAVYHTGPPLRTDNELLRQAVESYTYALEMMCTRGDDWGNMVSWAPQDTKVRRASMVRYNHCLYVWEDWFRGGDWRLRDVALTWSRNYNDLGVHWGADPEAYGSCRRGRAWRKRKDKVMGPGTYMVRYDKSPIYVHKGFSNFYLAFEETGDPRYEHAALMGADYSARAQHAGLSYTRVIGAVADSVKLYEYTGQASHLENAVRLWGTFQPCQGEDLLFTESGKPATGNDFYIPDDRFGYHHPFVKPYIVQYATNALPYLLAHRPDDTRLRDTIVALNDFMVGERQPAGGWGYPGGATASMGWNNEYMHGIMLAHHVQPNEEYLDAIGRHLRAIVALRELHGEVPSGVNPWEFAAGINVHERAEMYTLKTDRDPWRDYTEGVVRFGQGPDGAVYFGVLLRDWLLCREEGELFAPDELLEKIKLLPTTLK